MIGPWPQSAIVGLREVCSIERRLMRAAANPDMWGPLNEYDQRVQTRQLREDEHQRGKMFSSTGEVAMLKFMNDRNRAMPSRPSRHAQRLPRP